MFGKDITERIAGILIDSCEDYLNCEVEGCELPDGMDPQLQLTRDPKHGDLTSNIAMRLAKIARRSPKEIAEGILAVFSRSYKSSDIARYLGKVEIKGGFINIFLSDPYFDELLKEIFEKRSDFGRSDNGKGQRVDLEYVSANPTGPLTIAHGRQAAIGDALSRILRFSGYEVTNEYYLNDFGRQIRMLGLSVETRYRNMFGENEEMPEDGYMGEYIIDIARSIREDKGDSLLERSQDNSDIFRRQAVEYMMALIRKDLDDFGVRFDVWTSQAGIEERDEVSAALEMLGSEGYLYEKDGAKWFASTRFGDDKDRVVVKSDGSYTYLAPDIAYHRDKYDRGYSRLIDLLGPDHHGYINRMKAAVRALGHDAGSLDILIVQLVTLLRGGEAVSMSTRRGEFISLRELLDELGKDVTRFFFLSRRLDSHLDFDIELAKKESSDNPVYYIQYAHARICSIKKFSEIELSGNDAARLDCGLLSTPPERSLIRKMAEFPFAVSASASSLEPNRVIVYLNELSRCFHSFYTECRVVQEDEGLTIARLFLVECARIVLANGLDLLGIDMPERM